MERPILKGLGFGITSGVITTLGLLIGLSSGTHSKLAVIGGIVALAFSDALSDAMGIHVSEEAEDEHKSKEIWTTSLYTLASKFFFTLSFVIPVLLFELNTAIIISITWGLLLLSTFSIYISKVQGKNTWRVVSEHVIIAVVVIISAHYIGQLIYEFFS